jgi:hypothetical protein
VRHTADIAARRPEPKLSGVARIALDALREAIGEYGELMPATSTIPKGVHAVTLERWRERFKLRYGSDPGGDQRRAGTTRQAFLRAREHLATANAVEVCDPFVWVTQ